MDHPTNPSSTGESTVRLAVRFTDEAAAESAPEGLRESLVGILAADGGVACSVEDLPPFGEEEVLALVVPADAAEAWVGACAEAGLVCERLDQEVEAHSGDAAGGEPLDRDLADLADPAEGTKAGDAEGEPNHPL